MLIRRRPPPSKPSISVWQQGANAARDGQGSADCPYEAKDYKFVVWHNGWVSAKYFDASGIGGSLYDRGPGLMVENEAPTAPVPPPRPILRRR